MSAIEQKVIIWVLLTMLGLLAWIGKLSVSKLGSIAESVGKMEKDLSVLANDHTNLKESHTELKGRVKSIEKKIFESNGQYK